MGLATVFKLSIYTLTGFVGLALGVAEQGLIPFISLPITALGYWWCEIGRQKGWFSKHGLGETPAICLGFLALVAATIEFFSENQEGKLLAGIHLVVYLTWIVLLQQKSNYRYWLLMTLCMMHVAVGSVLTNATWYGLAMVVYLFGAIWTLSVFSLYRAAQEFAAVEPDLASVNGKTSRSKPNAPPANSRSEVINNVRLEDHAGWISPRLFMGTSFTSVAGLLVGALFFALIPRVWVGTALGISDDSLPPAMRRNVTGQATEIRLGDMGPILASNDPVLTLRIFDNQTGRPMDAQSYAESIGLREPLFRGAVMTDYIDGRWRQDRAALGATAILATDPKDQMLPQVPMVRQEIHLERIGNDILPCLGRAMAVYDPTDAERSRVGRIQLSNALIVRRAWFQNLPGAVNYNAYTELPGKDHDIGLIASPPELVVYRISDYIRRCSEFPEDLVRLKALSDHLIETAQQKVGEPLTDIQKARVIESYLRDSGEFVYSLETKPLDPNADPVEDFVFSTRAGHCQYFASALALMLRAAKIPARLSAGFKGGEELADGRLNVEKRFAHVWVEAWIENRKWMTFDATPEDGRAESVTAIGSKRNMWTAMTARLAGIWESNILDISYERQDSIIYEPLREIIRSVVAFVRQFWNSPAASSREFFNVIVDPRSWLTVPGAITLATLAGLLWLLRTKTRLFRFSWRKKQADTIDPMQQRVEFYDRFVRLMKSRGRSRQLSQTQQEFVQEMENDLTRSLPESSLNGGLNSIGDSFYRIRFGSGELTEQEQQHLNDLLSKLEQDLSISPKQRLQSI